MIYIEAIMISLMIYVGIFCAYTDIKQGIIKNKILILALCAAVILNFVYYYIYAKTLFLDFIINLVAISLFSALMYFYNIWSAGDSKMLIVESMLIPIGLYNSSSTISVDSVGIIILIFSIAYIYLFFETLYIGVTEKNLFSISNKRKLSKDSIFIFLKRYIQCSVYITLLNFIYVLVFPEIYFSNVILFMLLNLFFILTVYRYDVIFNNYLFAVVLCIEIILIILFKIDIIHSINYKIYALLLFVILFRAISEKYNYSEIKTSDIKQGMILSLGTVMLFGKSRVVGLPKSTTEDLRSRISKEEADSIKRWEKSKYGKPSITIVKKMPFAIFIFLGLLIFVIIRLWKQ